MNKHGQSNCCEGQREHASPKEPSKISSVGKLSARASADDKGLANPEGPYPIIRYLGYG